MPPFAPPSIWLAVAAVATGVASTAAAHDRRADGVRMAWSSPPTWCASGRAWPSRVLCGKLARAKSRCPCSVPAGGSCSIVLYATELIAARGVHVPTLRSSQLARNGGANTHSVQGSARSSRAQLLACRSAQFAHLLFIKRQAICGGAGAPHKGVRLKNCGYVNLAPGPVCPSQVSEMPGRACGPSLAGLAHAFFGGL
jgi:hypothetical protein